MLVELLAITVVFYTIILVALFAALILIRKFIKSQGIQNKVDDGLIATHLIMDVLQTTALIILLLALVGVSNRDQTCLQMLEQN